MEEQEMRRRYARRTRVAIPRGPQGEVFLNLYNIHADTVTLNLGEDKYLTPAPKRRPTRAIYKCNEQPR